MGGGPEHVHPLLGTGGDGVYGGGSARLGQTHAEVVFVGSGGHDVGGGGRRGGEGGRRGEKRREEKRRGERQKKKTADRPPQSVTWLTRRPRNRAMIGLTVGPTDNNGFSLSRPACEYFYFRLREANRDGPRDFPVYWIILGGAGGRGE